MRENGRDIGIGSMEISMKIGMKMNLKTKSLTFWISCLLPCSPLAPAAEVCIPEFEARPSFAVGDNFGTSVLGDFDEDGTDDLLVGEFHEGRLRVFRNIGSRSAPDLPMRVSRSTTSKPPNR